MKVLYILPSYNIYGGTAKKTLDLLNELKEDAVLYVHSNAYAEFRHKFEASGGKVYEGPFGRNVFLHIKKLRKIIKNEHIDIVQTQFSMGELLGYLLKLLIPKLILIVAFVGPFKPRFLKGFILKLIYAKVDMFIYVSNFVKLEKQKQFPLLKKKKARIIYNGTKNRQDISKDKINMNKLALLDVAGLVYWKNISVLIEALDILINKKNHKNIFLYVAGDGPENENLENLTRKYNLQSHVQFLGYQKNIGNLMHNCDVFVHPAFAEGFGIAVAEAMHAGKPIIVSNAGALPELIEHEQTGLVINPFSPQEWANAILRYINEKDFAKSMARGAKIKAHEEFSVEAFAKNYKILYMDLIASG